MLSVSVPLIMYFYHLSVSSTCHFYRAVSACIHACVFPILSLAVVLLYMGLSPATAARVSDHLYVFFCYVEGPFIWSCCKKVKSSDKTKQAGHEVRRYTVV